MLFQKFLKNSKKYNYVSKIRFKQMKIYKTYMNLMTEKKMQVKYRTMRSKSKRKESTSVISTDESAQFALVLEKIIKNVRVK